LEVDERNMERVRAAIPAQHIAVTNIQKDQVQRNGDPDYIFQKIKRSLDDGVTLFVNNEEPRSASLARYAGRSVSFGVSRIEQAPPASAGWSAQAGHGVAEFAVTMACPACHDALDFAWHNLANVGRFSCPTCGFSSLDKPDYLVDGVDHARRRFTVAGVGFHMEYDASHFLYNYALCCAIATESGIGAGDLARAFQTFTNVGGRLEEFTHGDKQIRYVRMKQENPETVQSGLDDVAKDPRPKVFMVGLQLVHDFTPHYTNTAYFFDCDVDALLASGVEVCICFGSVNCHDAATRLAYAGFPTDKIIVVDSDDPADVMAALAQCQARQAYLITMLGMYESLRAWADRHDPGDGSQAVGSAVADGSAVQRAGGDEAFLTRAETGGQPPQADPSVIERAVEDEALLARARGDEALPTRAKNVERGEGR
jgi:Zn ribbon nucleic-acid-binding protein